MNNYQLYRTNAKLGGQVSWNLVLEDIPGGQLAVKYFDLTPISPNVNYKYGQNRDCIRYSHQENLRTLYNEIKGQFYDAVIDPKLTTIYPIIDSDDKDTRDSSLEMGCSRISMSRYGKQLQVFCPLWLEDFKKDDVLSFTISLYAYTKELNDEGELVDVETVLSSKSLTLDLQQNSSYHDSFVNYFKNYLGDIIEDVVIGDDVLNVNITEKFASIHGLDIRTGKLASKDISTLVPNLFERERPLMETDFMLIDNYHTSVMVTKQLFNFNLVFDIADLVSNIMNNMLRDDEFFIKVDVSKNGVQLEKRSFNNNYSSLDRPTGFKDVFKYLQDDKCIDNIRDNKLAPDICHWTLNDNTGYIFNVYPGFSTVYDMFYKDAPNYWEYDVTKYPNAINWINNFETKNIDDALNSILFNPNFTVFDPEKTFFKDTRVDLTKIPESITEKENLVSFIIKTDNKQGQTINNIIDSLEINDIHDYVFLTPEDSEIKIYISDTSTKLIGESIVGNETRVYNQGFVLFVLTRFSSIYILVANEKDQNLLSFKWINKAITLLQEFFQENELTTLTTVKTMIDAIDFPKIIYLYNSLGIKRADSPWIETNEISYVKINNKNKIVIRYDGKIKPMFSTFDDLVMYRVRKMTADEFSIEPAFQKDQTQGFLPNYPSVGYFNLEYVDKNNYNKSNEYKWFNDSLVFNLISSINVRVFSKYLPHYYTNEELIEKILIDTYPRLSVEHLTYIRSLYNAEVSYEYDDPAWNRSTEQFDYIYTIKLELK